jgi:hypothetical protein
VASKQAPQAKPRALKARHDKAVADRAAKIKQIGETYERHDAARSVRTKVATDKRRNVSRKKLALGERQYPGKLTKDGRKGAKVVRVKTTTYDPHRARALEDAARARTIAAGTRVTESQIVAEALARYGIGSKSLSASEVAP